MGYFEVNLSFIVFFVGAIIEIFLLLTEVKSAEAASSSIKGNSNNTFLLFKKVSGR